MPVKKNAMCKHYECRCRRAVELAAYAEMSNDWTYLVAAIRCHTQEVRCRVETRSAPVRREGDGT